MPVRDVLTKHGVSGETAEQLMVENAKAGNPVTKEWARRLIRTKLAGNNPEGLARALLRSGLLNEAGPEAALGLSTAQPGPDGQSQQVVLILRSDPLFAQIAAQRGESVDHMLVSERTGGWHFRVEEVEAARVALVQVVE